MSMHSYMVSDDPKALRETLCAAQYAMANSLMDKHQKRNHMDRLQRLISECDRLRPPGPDGKHGNRHTPTRGCDDQLTADRFEALRAVARLEALANYYLTPRSVARAIRAALSGEGYEHERCMNIYCEDCANKYR